MITEADVLIAVRELADAIHDEKIATRVYSEAESRADGLRRAYHGAEQRTQAARRRLMELIAEIRPTDPGIGVTDPIQLLTSVR